MNRTKRNLYATAIIGLGSIINGCGSGRTISGPTSYNYTEGQPNPYIPPTDGGGQPWEGTTPGIVPEPAPEPVPIVSPPITQPEPEVPPIDSNGHPSQETPPTNQPPVTDPGPQPTGNLSGIVRNPSGRTISGATVSAYDYDPLGNVENFYTVTTDVEGRFATTIPGGVYDIIVRGEGLSLRKRYVGVGLVYSVGTTRALGDNMDVTLRSPGRITGRINFPSGAETHDLDNLVYLLNAQGQVVVTNSNFSFPDLPVGETRSDSTYRLKTRPFAYNVFNLSTPVDVPVDSGTTTNQDLALDYTIYTIILEPDDSGTGGVGHIGGTRYTDLFIGEWLTTGPRKNDLSSYLTWRVPGNGVVNTIDLVMRTTRLNQSVFPLTIGGGWYSINDMDAVIDGTETPASLHYLGNRLLSTPETEYRIRLFEHQSWVVTASDNLTLGLIPESDGGIAIRGSESSQRPTEIEVIYHL